MSKEFLDFIKTRKKANLTIIIINILVFLAMELLGSTGDLQFMYEHGVMFVPAVLEKGEYYRLFTCMFQHFGAEHLLYNMLLLLFMGDMLEAQVGKIRYLVIYLMGGLAGNLLSMAVAIRQERYVLSAGASGAVFAVVGALLYLVIRHGGKLGDVGLKRLGIMAALSLAQGFTEAGTDNMAHLGGFLGGLLLCIILYHGGGAFPSDTCTAGKL